MANANVAAGALFSVNGIVAVVTGGGTGIGASGILVSTAKVRQASA